MKHTPNTVLYARRLAGAISHRLESAGRTHVVVRREWFVDDVPHELLVLNVPITSWAAPRCTPTTRRCPCPRPALIAPARD
jgi:hypothetical protein